MARPIPVTPTSARYTCRRTDRSHVTITIYRQGWIEIRGEGGYLMLDFVKLSHDDGDVADDDGDSGGQ